ncbi:MAG: L,D-transpeptidase family protein [Fibrobacterales bacterium]
MKLFSNSYIEQLQYRLENRAFLAKIKRDRRSVAQAFKPDSVNIPFYTPIDIEVPELDFRAPFRFLRPHIFKFFIALIAITIAYLSIMLLPDFISSDSIVESPSPSVKHIETPTTIATPVSIVTKAKETPPNTVKKKAEPIPAIPIPQYAVLVIKSTKALHIVKQTNQKWDIVQSLSIATGEFEGDKQVEGDKKTPEGNYFIKDIRTGPSQGYLYGALVFKLNYPNETDVKTGKTGSGIWIHGVEFGLTPVYTKGCVALANKDVVKLAPYLTIGTPVTILPEPPKQKLEEIFSVARLSKEYPDIYNNYVKVGQSKEQLTSIFSQANTFSKKESNYLTKEKIQSTSQETYDYFREFVSKWKTAWESRNAKEYGTFYHPNFIDNRSRSKNAFIERKAMIFGGKDSISVKIERIQVFHKSDTLIQVSFLQDYTAFTGTRSKNWGKRTKHLYLKKHNDNWLINTEK